MERRPAPSLFRLLFALAGLLLEPAAGIKASRITNLSKDLARSLSTVSVRVVEVIPGKTCIGLEIPNEHKEIVSLSDILKSDVYEGSSSKLTMALGKDISGKPTVADLAKLPHLLLLLTLVFLNLGFL